jgi:hypothetical protein
LKTPLGKELVINSKALALAVAEEWGMQKENIQLDPMHLVYYDNVLYKYINKYNMFFFIFRQSYVLWQ